MRNSIDSARNGAEAVVEFDELSDDLLDGGGPFDTTQSKLSLRGILGGLTSAAT